MHKNVLKSAFLIHIFTYNIFEELLDTLYIKIYLQLLCLAWLCSEYEAMGRIHTKIKICESTLFADLVTFGE